MARLGPHGSRFLGCGGTLSRKGNRLGQVASDLRCLATLPRPRLASVPMDPVTLAEAIDRIVELARGGEGGTVFTPNADHIVVAHENPAFRVAYEEVSLSLVDGTPVFWLSRLLGLGLPEKVSGSDLFEPLVGRLAEERLPIYLLGGGPGVAELAAQNLSARFPGLEVRGLGAPKMDKDGHLTDEDLWLEKIRATAPAVVFVACGAPKSELFSARCRRLLAPAVLVCVGASIDFAAGTLKRAPAWISKFGLEWAYRLLREPKRLAYRYLVRDPKFLWLALKPSKKPS
jgi:N-acetylglucosaminyldiphosphoundecaprenol N-acetyl-beta-D-mannosaminyltransferase